MKQELEKILKPRKLNHKKSHYHKFHFNDCFILVSCSREKSEQELQKTYATNFQKDKLVELAFASIKQEKY
ncbi:MAG: hypothetical protein DWQ10_10495 [Calditrichaeota bacterium]|nr:MAG: hypothetical protein DWQ10_10495 [Calditrichota bacterium]